MIRRVLKEFKINYRKLDGMVVVPNAPYIVARKLPNGRMEVFGASFHLTFDSFDRASEIADSLILEDKRNNSGEYNPENIWQVYGVEEI